MFRGRQWTVSRMTARCTRIEKRRSVSPCNANCDILWNCPRTDIPIMLALGLRFACPYSHLRSPRLEFQLGFYLSQNEFEEEFVGRKMGERLVWKIETFAICRLWFIFLYVYFRYTYTGNNFFYLHERFFQRYENRYRVKNNRKDKLAARRKNDSTRAFFRFKLDRFFQAIFFDVELNIINRGSTSRRWRDGKSGTRR